MAATLFRGVLPDISVGRLRFQVRNNLSQELSQIDELVKQLLVRCLLQGRGKPHPYKPGVWGVKPPQTNLPGRVRPADSPKESGVLRTDTSFGAGGRERAYTVMEGAEQVEKLLLNHSRGSLDRETMR